MNNKLSSDFTKVFQIAVIVKFITLSIVCFILLFIFDFKTSLVMLTLLIICFFILRNMGITKLKTVYWNEESLIIGSFNSKFLIPIADIKDVKRTFLFDDFPFKMKYIKSGKIEKVYFLPKSKFFKGFFSGNEHIEALKQEIEKYK
ncbi:hypothetical protein J8L88_17570 [Aquimarina sp. MMG015]|nr:hypothetical protein [Aquimarina sp. MMG015]